MTTYSYIVITDSTASKSKRFRVIQGGYKPTLDKRQTIEETVNGGLDIATGAIYGGAQYTFRLTETENDGNYGSKSDLEYFYQLNNPNGTPSNILTVTDHFGVNHSGVFDGSLSPEPVTTIIEGTEAWFIVSVQFRFLPS
jgi:hypothetical protein